MKKLLLSSLAICSVMWGTAQTSYNWTQDSQEVRTNQYGQKVNRQVLTAEERDGILVFESKNQSYRFWFDNRVQIDGAMFWAGKNDNYNKIGNGISFRRVRFAVKAQLHDKWYGEIDLNVANGSLELEDAYLKFTPWSWINFKAGNFKENFSMENTTTSRYLTFMERPMIVSAMVPSRHIGFQVNYNHRYFLAQGGVFFQEIKNSELAETIVDENNKVYGVDQGHSFTGRFVVMPFDQEYYGLHIGAAISYGTPKTDVKFGAFNTVRYSARALSSINRKKYLDTDRIPNVMNYIMQGYELAGFYGPLKVQGEYFQNNVRRLHGTPTNIFNGWYAYAAVLLFGGQQQYDRSSGEFTQPTRGRKWGDIELAARYDFANLNSRDIKGGSAEGITVGLNYYINSNVKLMFNYSRINNDRYANGKGDLFVGYDAAGQLTKNPDQVVAKKGKAGNDFNQMAMRIEIDF